MINVEGAAADGAKQNVVVANDELALAKAHRQATVATTSRLIKHDGPAFAN
jgi:hypothetical protein